ncbi:HK97 gp10 family phage protein [Rhizobium lentis]|uniref:HK97 gp10 family phage protein n=1 Tax=Rhizobium lentis TaxID=1138194 RepID=UPI001C83E68C|nr:HK97 gp10 family phage protein [Rhizobium lentis]MBX5175323.1 HK97 gp10 family phage protein [Rhizobium lentis]
MTNAFNFGLDLRKFVDSIPEEMVKPVVQKFAMHALRGVVLKSPVDTGRFRGNWNVAVNRIDYSVTPETDRSGGSVIAKGMAVIGAAEPGQAIYISNNLPYAVVLENGHSKQAPAGVVALTFAELESMII